jgi:hypothetical protein
MVAIDFIEKSAWKNDLTPFPLVGARCDPLTHRKTVRHQVDGV